jgi:hypothetical protein
MSVWVAIGGSGDRRLSGAALLALAIAFLAPTTVAKAAFPGDNGMIAFTSTRDNGTGDIYAMNPDGSGAKRLTTTGVSDSPAWSPNGQRIAFASGRDGDWDVYVMNADGSGVTNLTAGSGALDTTQAWSPDGTKIAFMSDRTGNYEIYTMSSDGSNQINRTNNPASDEEPAWSPDGARIAFVSLRGGGEHEIWAMNADGSGATNLTNDTSVGEYDPNWSPDGTRIAFTTFRDSNLEIYKMNANGTGRVRVTNNAVDIDREPAWSPDGAKIAFSSYRSTTNQGIFVINADGGGEARLSPGSTYDTSPNWQPFHLNAPQSASSLSASLVPAFQPCGTLGYPATGSHPPPLAVGSCSPTPVSDVARIGALGSGAATLTVVAGDTDPSNGDGADVGIVANLNDVQTLGGGDYAPNPAGPDLTLDGRIRITDRSSGSSQANPATMVEVDFPVPMECVGTGNPATGSACAANTSMDAVVGGCIKENKTMVVQEFRIRVHDSGLNGNRGDTDDGLLAMQGVFIP